VDKPKRKHRHTGRKPTGRPLGTRNALKPGEVSAVDMARLLCEKLGEDDAVTREVLAMLAAIARGDRGWNGRHIGERLRAVIELGHHAAGKPAARPTPGESPERLEALAAVVAALAGMSAEALRKYAESGELQAKDWLPGQRRLGP
jgi:hypothetical protein